MSEEMNKEELKEGFARMGIDVEGLDAPIDDDEDFEEDDEDNEDEDLIDPDDE